MSYQSEHKLMKPVLDLARQLDIATNPHPSAIFEAGNGGFQVWCTPQDHPQGWNGISMIAGAFCKPCAYVGSVLWKWDGEHIVGLQLETAAYVLAEQKPLAFCDVKNRPGGYTRESIFNRPDDIAWLKEKVTWLFDTAGIPLDLLPFDYEGKPEPEPGHWVLAYYTAPGDEYVVIVSPESNPEMFRREGYHLVSTLEIGNAVDFPEDTVLRPDENFYEGEVEPDEGPLVEQYENAARLGDDSWLEAAYEDRISGLEE
ncbi:MAG: hypothetical protein EHM40_16710 [Chloroflexi bacterium]|nr:MAG: hypothetical protein EHM40_16710 [Chloroflexota bacterium]